MRLQVGAYYCEIEGDIDIFLFGVRSCVAVDASRAVDVVHSTSVLCAIRVFDFSNHLGADARNPGGAGRGLGDVLGVGFLVTRGELAGGCWGTLGGRANPLNKYPKAHFAQGIQVQAPKALGLLSTNSLVHRVSSCSTEYCRRMCM